MIRNGISEKLEYQIHRPLIFLTNLVTPQSGKQNDKYGHQKTAVWHIVVGGRWNFHVHATDQHHIVRGALHDATKMAWYVAIVESTKKTLMRFLAPTSNLT
jgi:hypothetical protein